MVISYFVWICCNIRRQMVFKSIHLLLEISVFVSSWIKIPIILFIFIIVYCAGMVGANPKRPKGKVICDEILIYHNLISFLIKNMFEFWNFPEILQVPLKLFWAFFFGIFSSPILKSYGFLKCIGGIFLFCFFVVALT